MSPKSRFANLSLKIEQDPSWESVLGKMYYRSRILAENFDVNFFQYMRDISKSFALPRLAEILTPVKSAY